MTRRTIISGGQSGADLAGNRFALDEKWDTWVNICSDFRPINPNDLLLFETLYQRIVTPAKGVNGLRIRTRYNVQHSDATVIFVTREIGRTRGSLLTANLCKKLGKEFCIVNVNGVRQISLEKLGSFLGRVRPKILNVAGERIAPTDRVIEALRETKKEW